MAERTLDKQNSFLSICKYLWSGYSIIIITVCIFILCGIIVPQFLAISNLMIVLRQASIIGMIALGMTFVIIAGGIDLSAGHVAAASGTVLILLQGNEAIPLWVSILACFAVAMFMGFVNGVVITKFRVPAFIVTLAIGLIVRSVALYAAGGVSITGRRIPEFTNIGNGSVGIIPNALIIWVVCAVILGCLLAFTKFGSYVYAVGSNETAARYSGIAVDRIRIICYTLVGFCVGMSALLNFSRMAAISAATASNLHEFDAITAVVVGGTTLAGGRGKIMGTFFGMIIVGVVSNLMIMFNISVYLTGLVKGGIILVAILTQRKD